MITTLFGKTYAWTRIADRWRLVRLRDLQPVKMPWDDPEHDVLADLRAAR